MKPKVLKRIINIACWATIVLFCLLTMHYLLWIFATDKFSIRSESMMPTIIPGDQIVVNKLLFGARIYSSLDFSDHAPLKAWRVKGFRKIKPNEIIVFNFPYGYNNWSKIEFRINYVYAKRVIGAPGDSVSIVDGHYRNNHHEGSLGVEKMQATLQGIPDSTLMKINSFRAVPLSRDLWSIKHFGPLYIPAKGDAIHLTRENGIIYKRIIEYETKDSLVCTDGLLYKGDQLVDQYMFTKNYYFACGDNTPNSNDSRYWGFVPEDFIIGIVTRVAYSRDPETHEIRWDRVWKKL